MTRTLWLLDGDEHVVALAEQTRAGDFVVRRHDEVIEVGSITDGDEPRIAWFGEVDAAVMPAVESVDLAEDRIGPLQRIPDGDDLRAAIEGIEVAERNRGG